MPTTVAELMEKHPARMRPQDGIGDAVRVVLELGLTEVYIADEADRLLGVVPDYELLKTQLNGICRRGRVEEIASGNVATIAPATPAAEAAARFREGRCRQLAVVEEGVLLGVLRRADLLKFLDEASNDNRRAIEAEKSHAPADGSPAPSRPPSIQRKSVLAAMG